GGPRRSANRRQSGILALGAAIVVVSGARSARRTRSAPVWWNSVRRCGRPTRQLGEHLAYDPLVNPRKRSDVLDRRAFADLVHRRVGQAEIDDRAELDQEAAIRR